MVHGQIFAIFIKNHSTLRAMFLFSSSRLWFSLTADVEQKSLKTKNGLHLKAVASILKRMWYLWPVGDSALSHLNGCFGYFCLEQSVFLWIVVTLGEGGDWLAQHRMMVARICSIISDSYVQILESAIILTLQYFLACFSLYMKSVQMRNIS